MKKRLTWHRPIGRIDRVLSRLRRLWHYYPGYSFYALVLETAIYANRAESDLPSTSIDEIEDIAYPEGHMLHGIRDLEMGIDWLEEFYKDEPLPPVPIQIADLDRFGDYWRRNPQERLGQLVSDLNRLAELELERVANGN